MQRVFIPSQVDFSKDIVLPIAHSKVNYIQYEENKHF